MKLRLSGLFLLVLTTMQLFAQSVSFTASSPKVVGVGEQFAIKYTLNAEGMNFRAPSFPDMSVLSGPNSSSSSSVSIVNGQVTRSTEYTYTYYVRANKQGKVTIPPASVQVKNKQYTSNSLTIDVAKSQSNSQARNNQTKNTITNKDLYVSILLNKSTAYVGEQILATIKIYTKLNLTNFQDVEMPSFNGFLKQDIKTINDLKTLNRENVNGEIYNTGIIHQAILIPQRSGELVIEPFTAQCIIRKETGRRTFFGPQYQNIVVNAKSREKKLTIKSLPSNKPKDFSGAVGTMNMTATIDKNQLKANEAFHLKIRISGNGNLRLINELPINFPSDFDPYPPEIKNNLKTTTNGISGSKTLDYLVIPRHQGNYKIPPIEFSYFDINSGAYKTIRSREFNIFVEKGEDEGTTQVISGFSKEDVKFIGKDIRYIKTGNFELRKMGDFFVGSTKFYFLLIVPLLMAILIYVIYRMQVSRNSNQLLVKNRKANSLAKKRLKKALDFMNKNESEKFYEEIARAIWGYLSDKLSIPVSELSMENSKSRLMEITQDENLIENLSKIIETCEIARYSPSMAGAEMEVIYKDTIQIISNLEQKIK